MGDLSGRILGHYRVVERIGAGGMGEVYRAHDERLERDVAIKVLPDRVAEDPDRMKRFEREAKVLASLNHPNIATLFGLEEHESSRFLVMELVEGESLDAVIARGALPTEEAVTLAIDIARALESAHERGVIHRDLKPANVMIDSEGHVKVLDFGLAKAFDPSEELPRSVESIAESPTLTAELTLEGALLGTAAYMCPEQAQGKPVDRRCDVWAFGCVLFEMLTGDRPFHGTSSTDVAAAILKDEPDWSRLPSVTPVSVRRVLRRCLTKDRRDRLHDVADARIELQTPEPFDATLNALDGSKPMVSRWRRALPWLVSGVLGVALVVVTVGLRQDGREQAPAPGVVRATIDLPESLELANLWDQYLWNGPMRNELAFSPDGTTLVFSATQKSSPEPLLYRLQLGSNDFEMIRGTEGGVTPFFSPDGRWIAFWAAGELRKIEVDSGLPVTLAEYHDPSGSFPFMGGSWGPDGTIFLGSHLDGLLRVSSDGGPLETVTVPDRETEYAHRLPQALPGGRAVLFTVAYSYTGARGHIEVVSLVDGTRKVLIDDGLDARFVQSGHVVYMHEGTLMAAPFDVEALELTGRALPVLTGVLHATNLSVGWANSGAGIFTVANNGTLVYAAGGMASDLPRRLAWIDHRGMRQTVANVPNASLRFPRISPDGRWLAFVTRGLESTVWVHDLVRGTNTKLTNDGRIGFIAWAPDGDHLVVSYSRGGVGNLHRLNRRPGGTLERLSESEFLQQPGSWSPDGRYLAYVQWRPTGGPSIWLFDAVSRTIEPMFKSDDKFSFPDFSPDGHWLAYVSNESGESNVWITSFPGRTQHVIVSPSGGEAPVWAPDGRTLYYVSRSRALMAVDIRDDDPVSLDDPRVVLDGPFPTIGPIRGYDITADGSQFIISEVVESEAPTFSPRQLQVVVNWFDELGRLVPTD